MTDRTTALVLTGPASVGAFKDDLWRVGHTAQLVEGGNSGPVWVTSPATHDEDGSAPDHLLIDSDDPEIVARSLIVVLAATTGNQTVLDVLARSISITLDGGRRVIQQPWMISNATIAEISSAVADSLRLGIVRLSDVSVLTDSAVSHLRAWGFRVAIFTSSAG